MSDGESLLSPNTLWPRTLEQTQFALDCGALQPIPTEFEYLQQGEIRFLVRILANIDRKAKAKAAETRQAEATGKPFNPFLPYDEKLFVANLSPSHVCLLNKFNVVEHHLLIVTREFEHQNTWLTVADFAALQIGFREIDGLGFYNGGTEAGASQPHKHLQLVPLPLMPDGDRLPIEGAIAHTEYDGTGLDKIGRSPWFPFNHAIAPISPDSSPEQLQQQYYRLLNAVGLIDATPKTKTQTGAYNLLATRNWLMVVRRSQEGFAGISLNALGFAGALLVRNSQQLEHLKTLTPLGLLGKVAPVES
ncbi:MAG: phosphorylase [Phormidium sp. BM_Day4_Bin.17]|nr:phosphorylase [Phormidium sp. BM_Day4_Bin.17]UCJ14045.1 MAG: phosphorylase [Phormidium sp. PBR-2020]